MAGIYGGQLSTGRKGRPGRNPPYGPGVQPQTAASRYFTRQSEVPLGFGETVHYKPGSGFYGAKKGTGVSYGNKETFDLRPPQGPNGPALPPGVTPGSSSPAPTADKNAAAASAVAGSALSAQDLLANYGIERAKILGQIGPQIQSIYDQASSNLTQNVGDLTGSMRDQLTQQGHEAAGVDAQGKPLDTWNPTAQRIAAAYNPQGISNAAYYLGAALPASTLTQQGAAWGAAASLLPAAALQQTQYSIIKAIDDAKLKNAEASKVNASLSKMMGYLVDAYGNPVLGKNGKPVKVPDAQMTPYQKAQIGLAKGRMIQTQNQINWRRYESDRNYQLSVDKANASDKRYYAGMTYKSEQAAALAREKANQIDWATTKNLNDGHIHLKGGGILFDAHKRAVTWTPAQAAGATKNRTVYQNAKLDAQAKAWYEGAGGKLVQKKDALGNPVLDANGNPEFISVGKGAGKISYQVALRKLTTQYGLKLADAQSILDTYWKRGERGRPFLAAQERQTLLSLGYPPDLVRQATTDVHAYNQIVGIYQQLGPNARYNPKLGRGVSTGD